MLPFRIVAALLPGVALAAQQPFVQPAHDLELPSDNSSAPFIFNALSGLLQQWPNTYHWNGHTIVPGTLEPFTLLYHARRDPDIPDAEEWFAFDPEMSYGIMGGRGLTFMLTYQTLRPVKVIYFDGMSASLSDSGWLDSQEVILSGKGKGDNTPMEGGGVFGEDRRLRGLCKWARKFNVEGIVRMNAGFELMWCDFQSPSIQLVSYLNVTAPGTPYWNGSGFPWPGGPGRGPGRPPEDRPDHFAPSADPDDPPNKDPPQPPRRGPGRDPHGGPFSGPPSPFASTSFPEWLRAATVRNLSPQPHVALDLGSFVTFYNPRYESLARARASQKGMREHRAWLNISDEDAAAVVREELAAVSSFIASLPQNVIPGTVDPSQPIDPQLVLDFDTMAAHAAEEVDAVVKDVWAQHPVMLYSKFYSPVSRELKQILSDLYLRPAPTIVEVDQRVDESVLAPLLFRLTGKSELPILLVGGARSARSRRSGLLIDSERVYTEVTNNILAKYGKEMTWDIKAGLMGKPEREAAAHLLSFFPDLPSDFTIDVYIEQRRIGQDALWPTVQPLPGVLKLVQHLRRHSVPIAVATGSQRRNYEQKSAHLMDALFGVGEGEVGERSLGEAHRRERAKGLVFEDAIPGVQAGKRAGMNVVWVPDANLLALGDAGPTLDVEQPEQTLKSLEEFVPEEWGLPPYDAGP
ncbi:hypothetical protein EVJ58_g137 [Rhodofomes roseus]|uniref:Uncharacterized protein n=1 Tax=Rhodofomes roseus TaxID=34475 RepID=A0A4Y9Z7W3_9APHY|nr:hypothetical protein EVJ58_g137 [Rhodofomes roseus]